MSNIIDSKTSKLLTSDLTNAENKVRTYQGNYLLMGKELTFIHDNDLFKQRGFDNWKQYVECIFDMTRDYSYKFINAYAINQVLIKAGYKGASLPKTESQSRPLTSMLSDYEDKILEVWQNVITSDEKLTAKLVQIHVNTAIGKQSPVKATNKKADTGDNPLDILKGNDKTGTSETPEVKADVATLEAQLSELKAQNASLESELIKARAVKVKVPRSKMAIELYKAGFKVLAQSATPKQMDALISLKDTLVG